MSDHKPSPRVYLFALVLLQMLLAADVTLSLRYHHGDPGGVRLLWQFTLQVILVAWVRADRIARHFTVPFEFDVFVFFFWPVAVPFYLCWTRGWKGLLSTLGLLAVLIAPFLVAAIAYAVLFGLR